MKEQTTSFVKLIKLLNDGHYHDGTSLGNKLGMTRSAVWKAIKKLQNYEIQIDSVKGKGYALVEPLVLLDKKLISQALDHKNIEISILESVDSTNTYLTKNAAKKNIQICLSETQTEGKGRLNREWHSPFGQNIYLSCSYPFNKDISELSGLSLVVSLTIIKTLESYKLAQPILAKWPNDLIYDNKKMAGILIEIQAESHGLSHATIGIGMNVNILQDKNKTIGQAWTSLRNSIGEYVDRNHLAVLLINNLISYLTIFEKKGFEYFVNEWNSVDILVNKSITLKSANTKISGIAKGVNKLGHLVLKLPDGSMKNFSSGDTTILK